MPSSVAKKSNSGPLNVPSILLTDEENEKVFKILGRRCSTQATAVVQVFLAEAPHYNEWQKRCCGVACFVKDNSRKSYFIRILDLKNEKIVWEQELYLQFQYFTPLPFFHTFDCDTCPAALNFADQREAHAFQTAVENKLRQRLRSINNARLQRSQSTNVSSNNTPIHSQPFVPSHGQNLNYTTSQTSLNYQQQSKTENLTRQSFLLQSNGGPNNFNSNEQICPNNSNFTKTTNNRNKKGGVGGLRGKKSLRLKKADIGIPTDFVHIQHVGGENPNFGVLPTGGGPVNQQFNPNSEQFNNQNNQHIVRNYNIGAATTNQVLCQADPEVLRQVFAKAGVTAQHLQDRETADFIYEFVGRQMRPPPPHLTQQSQLNIGKNNNTYHYNPQQNNHHHTTHHQYPQQNHHAFQASVTTHHPLLQRSTDRSRPRLSADSSHSKYVPNPITATIPPLVPQRTCASLSTNENKLNSPAKVLNIPVPPPLPPPTADTGRLGNAAISAVNNAPLSSDFKGPPPPPLPVVGPPKRHLNTTNNSSQKNTTINAKNNLKPSPPALPNEKKQNIPKAPIDDRSALLSQIRKGIQLKHVANSSNQGAMSKKQQSLSKLSGPSQLMTNGNSQQQQILSGLNALKSKTKPSNQSQEQLTAKAADTDVNECNDSCDSTPLNGVAGALARALQERARVIQSTSDSSADDFDDEEDDEWEDE